MLFLADRAIVQQEVCVSVKCSVSVLRGAEAKTRHHKPKSLNRKPYLESEDGSNSRPQAMWRVSFSTASLSFSLMP